jgi:hypothetical protein
MIMVAAVPAMHEQVQQRAGEEQQPGEVGNNGPDVSLVLGPEIDPIGGVARQLE